MSYHTVLWKKKCSTACYDLLNRQLIKGFPNVIIRVMGFIPQNTQMATSKVYFLLKIRSECICLDIYQRYEAVACSMTLF